MIHITALYINQYFNVERLMVHVTSEGFLVTHPLEKNSLLKIYFSIIKSCRRTVVISNDTYNCPLHKSVL